MSVFTERAAYWMNEFKNNPGGDKKASRPVLAGVGSQWMQSASGLALRQTPKTLASFRHTHEVTDCITYATDVLKYAYLDIGNGAMAARVKQPPYCNNGVALARYLVNMEGWKAYYWNPDPGLSEDRKKFDESPEQSIGYYIYYMVLGLSYPGVGKDEDAYIKAYKENFLTRPKAEQEKLFETVKRYVNEHTYTALQVQGGHHDYYGIKTTDSVSGWRPNPRAKKSFTTFLGHANDTPEPPLPNQEATTHAKNRLAEFSRNVRFGFGLARGGRHTYLFGSGNIYEAHWEAGPADTTNQDSDPLYEVTRLMDWGWESGLIIVPGDAVVGMVLPQA